MSFIQDLIDFVLEEYIHNQWHNCRRAINKPQAEEELLSGAKMYFFTPGGFSPERTFMNKECTMASPHPVIADGYGHFPAIFLDATVKYDLKINRENDDPIITRGAEPEGETK